MKRPLFRRKDKLLPALLIVVLVILLVFTLGGSIWLFTRFEDYRCYHISPPFTYGEQDILEGGLLDCAVINCRVTFGFSESTTYSCYFRVYDGA